MAGQANAARAAAHARAADIPEHDAAWLAEGDTHQGGGALFRALRVHRVSFVHQHQRVHGHARGCAQGARVT
eukprot:scaffold18617_cov72-Phaeocystis_antarctica.AAC.2